MPVQTLLSMEFLFIQPALNAGEILAKCHPAKADIVIGVPDSGIDAALGFSRASGIPYTMD